MKASGGHARLGSGLGPTTRQHDHQGSYSRQPEVDSGLSNEKGRTEHARGDSHSREKPRVVMLFEANPYPQDVRLRLEAEALAAAGYAVEALVPRGRGQRRRERINGVEARRFRSLEGSVYGAKGFLAEYVVAVLALHLSALASLVRGASILHIHNPPDLFFPIAALYRLAGRKVVFDHHDLAPETIEFKFGRGLLSRLAVLFERLTFASSNHVIATNMSYAEVAYRRGHKKPSDVTIVRNAPPSSWIALPLRISEGALQSPHVVYAGAMSGQDGVVALARVMASLCEINPDLKPRLTIIGDGDERPNLEAECARLGVSDRVTFTGWVPPERVPELLQEADVCVEPAPPIKVNNVSTMTKVAEYLALGKPVVAYDMLETRRTVGDAALLVPADDTAGFAEQIARLARDPELRARLAQAARSRASEISWEHSEKSLLGLYEALTADL
jgi:glycosyltransferase involved in cell wall biosynthesis